jgi:thioredoxin reductase (NADPH)
VAELNRDDEPVRVIGHQWSRESHEVKNCLARYRVAYHWMETGSDDAQRAIRSVDAEPGRLPLLIFPDGSTLAAPTAEEVAEKLGLVTQEESPFYDLLIVGGGPAGLAAAVYASSEGLRTIIVEKETPGGQAATSAQIENFLGFPEGLSGGELSHRAVEQAKRFGTEFLAAHEATGLRAEQPYRVVTLSDGQELYGYAVLIATGVEYRRLDAPGAERLAGRGVYYGAASAEVNLCRGKEVCVLGGGNSAGQAAMLLSHYVHTVHILTTGDSLAESMSEYLVDRIESTENIRVHLHTTVAEAHGQEHLERVTLENTETGAQEEVSTIALFVFIGATPRTDWLSDVLREDEEGFVRSGEDLQDDSDPEPGWPLDRSPAPLETSMPGVFVAGDVRAGSVKRVVAAAGEGAMAVHFVHRYLSQR